MATSRAIGIDLGTTYSCVGVFQNGKVEIIANKQGNRTTPSVVSFSNVERLVGDAAKNQAAINPKNTIFDAKRLIGRSFDDPNIQEDIKHLPFNVVEKEGKLMVQAIYQGNLKSFLPEAISSMVLEYLKATAETYLGGEVKDAVVTVPAYFNGQQRQATLNAGKIAGLNILRIINEPSAAALAYGLHKKGKRNVLIFDLGGGTLDISILKIKDGSEFDVLATAGDAHLGGKDFDNKFVSFLADDFQRKQGKNVRDNPKAFSRLRIAAERAKRTLSESTVADIEVDSLLEGIDYSIHVSRARFEDICSELFLRTIDQVNKAVNDSGLDKASIDDVVLSGGSSRIPKIQALLKNYFAGKELTQSINGDEAVAYGATIQAAILSGCVTEDLKNVVLSEVAPLSLGVGVVGNLMSVVIPRNTKIPCQKIKGYYTAASNKITSLSIEVAEGERVLFSDNNFLGKFILDAITTSKDGTKLDVTFGIDANSILKVSAKDRGTGNEQKITIVRDDTNQMSATEISQMLYEANVFKKDDARRRESIEARLALENHTLEVISIVSSTPTENIDKKTKILQSCADVFQWLELNIYPEPDECKEKQKALTALAFSD